MNKHIFFIDPLEKLNIKKDSTLMMALKFQEYGHQCFVLLEKDFSVTNSKMQSLKLYRFEGSFLDDGYYLKDFKLLNSEITEVTSQEIIHMRIDPPYDSRYQRYLWMLDFLSHFTGCKVVNNPIGIMKHNEKLIAYKSENKNIASFIGSSYELFQGFLNQLNVKELILKPVDLYSGIGVEKVSTDDKNLQQKFETKVKDFQGAIVAQPFIPEVYQGEVRSFFFDGKEIGSILKKPQAGEFLANIAQGAKFEAYELDSSMKQECERLAQKLLNDGVRMIAYDILGDKINEMNVTCPGLIVEVSYALKKDLATYMASQF